MKKEELLFENLYKKCIKEWPKELQLTLKSELSQTVEYHPDGYQIIKCEYGEWDGKSYTVYINSNEDLEDLYDKICKKYYGTEEELLLTSFHEEIQNTISKSAIFFHHIKLHSIRKIYVRNNMEQSLKDFLSLKGDEHYRTKAEINLVHEYFRVNYSEQQQ